MSPGKQRLSEHHLVGASVIQRRTSGAPGRGEAMPSWQMDASLQAAMGLGEEVSEARSPWRNVQRTTSPSAKAPASRDGGGEAAVAELGARGVSGAGGAMPHAEAIQRSFGRHDIAGIRAHVGGEAAAASQALGAEAYATGNDVAFAGAPSLHTAAHEAAHVIQQRAGVHLKGGLDEPGDTHEQHADAVADAVVAGRSAEALLDRYAGGHRAGAGAGVQRKPIKDKDTDERHYHDDAHPKLRLIKEADSEEHEYRIKDRIQTVYWKDASRYFTDKEHQRPLDLTQFEATREFGAFVETFQEAAAMQHADEEGSEAAAMHLLQQFYTNALFDSSEVERLDYQASPLNYQDEHTYIRAAATSSVDVLKDRLVEDALGTDLEAYLAGQMDFRDTLHQMFRAVEIEEEPTEQNLPAKLGGLADGIAGHVAVRFAKKTEYEKANQEERDKVAKEAASYKGKISNLESAIKKTERGTLAGDDVTLFDWKADKEEYLSTQRDVEKERELRAKIEELDKPLTTPSISPPQSATPATPAPPQPQSVTPQPAKGKKATKPKDDPAVQKQNLMKALERFKGKDNAKKLSGLAAKLGIDNDGIGGLGAEAAAPKLEAMQLDKARAQKGPYAQLFVQLEKLKQEQAEKNAQVEEIDRRRFELMRDFDKAYGGLAFVDFTALLERMPLKQATAKIKQWGALATKVLLTLIEVALPKKGVPSTDVPKIMSELQKAKTLSKAFFTGGMMEVGSGKLSSPALLLEKSELAMPVKTALGKSGYVPTPTSANRQMVQGKVPLKELVLDIIEKQLKRQPISPETTAKLTQLRQMIAAFDPAKHQRIAAAPSQLEGARAAFAAFAKLTTHKEEHVTLMVRPVVQLFTKLDILSDETRLPPFALRQLEGHLRDATADASDVAALQRSVQNLHELVIYHLELSEGAAPGADTLSLPDGAQAPHVTPYGLTAFSHAFEGVLKQQAADGGGKLEVAALNNIYFEMMQKLGYTQGASGGAIGLSQPSSAIELIKGLKAPSSGASGVTAKATAPDMIVIDIHPNDASKTEIHQNDVVAMLHQLFGAASKDFRCTVLVDITLNHITEDEVVNIRNEARTYIDAGQLNLVFNQSLTKFAQFGTDKHSGGLMFHFNDGTHWQAFNQHVAECTAKDRVDPTIQKYFMALFQHTERENHEYLRKVRRNSRYVYEKLKEQLATIKCQEVLTLAENDDPRTCYVAFNYTAFAAKLLGPTANENQVKQLAHDILYGCINELAANLQLPLNMRTSFGFPLSNLGDIDPGIRLTVGIESRELLDRYVQILTFTNGAVGRQAESDPGKLTDVAARRQFLAEITTTVQTLEDLDKQIQVMQGGKGAQQTALPTGSQPASLAKGSSGSGLGATTSPEVPSALLYGEKVDVGINAVPNIGNSCYISALLNLFASSAAYRDMIAMNRPAPQPLEGPPVEPSQVQVLCARLHAAVTALRTPGAEVTDQMIREVRDSLRALGWLQAPDVVVAKKPAVSTPTPTTVEPSTKSVEPSAKSVEPSTKSVEPSTKSVEPSAKSVEPSTKSSPASKPEPSSEKALTAQQDAAEILQKLLGALTVPVTMQVGEQGRKQQQQDPAMVDHQGQINTGMLQLPISSPEVTTLEGALKKYCAAEPVENWGEKLISFRALPRTLTIALKRFDFVNYRAAKNYRRIAVPTEFEMPAECLHPDLTGQHIRYRMVSSVEHIGVYGGGHYVAHGRRDQGGGYRNDDQQDGTRAESAQELNENLANSYLYVFEQVVQ